MIIHVVMLNTCNFIPVYSRCVECVIIGYPDGKVAHKTFVTYCEIPIMHVYNNLQEVLLLIGGISQKQKQVVGLP